MNRFFASFVRRAAGRDGFIVVAVLWILTALATLATIFSIYVINTAIALSVHDERLQAEGLMRAALELSAYQVVVNPQGPPSSGTLVFRVGNEPPYVVPARMGQVDGRFEIVDDIYTGGVRINFTVEIPFPCTETVERAALVTGRITVG